MEIKEITISYGEKRSKNYNTEDHHLSITVELSEDELLERPLKDWFYFYDNKLRQAVNNMFAIEKNERALEHTEVKEEVKTIAYETISKDDKAIIYGSLIQETEKALKILNPPGERYTWMPKKAIRILADGKYEVLDWFFKKGFEVEWKNAE